jgi:hypothetical protein
LPLIGRYINALAKILKEARKVPNLDQATNSSNGKKSDFVYNYFKALHSGKS